VKNAEEARKTPCEMMRDLCAFALGGNYENQSRRRGSNPDLSDTKRNAVSFRVTILIPLIFLLDLIRRNILDTSLQFIIESCRAQFDWGFLYIRCVCCEVFTLLASGVQISSTLYSTWLNDPSTKLCYLLHYSRCDCKAGWAVSSE
jgi:hypothetical protein